MKNIFISLFLTLSSCAFAQNMFELGFIVNLKGDTIQGQIENLAWSQSPKSVNFKINETQIERYLPDAIQGFGIIGKGSYKSFLVKYDTTGNLLNSLRDTNPQPTYKQSHVFLRICLEAKLSLLEYVDQYRSHFFLHERNKIPFELVKHEYFINGKEGLTFKQTNPMFVYQLKNILICGNIDVPADLNYTETALVKLLTRYSLCKGEKSKVFANSNVKKISVGTIAYMGYDVNKIAGNFYGYGGGLHFNLALPYRKYRSSVSFEQSIRHYHQYDFIYNETSTFTKFRYKTVSNLLKLNVLYNHSFTKLSFKPKMFLGVTITKGVFDNSLTIERYNSAFNRWDFEFGTDKTYFNVGAIVGVGLPIGKNFEVDIRVEKLNGLNYATTRNPPLGGLTTVYIVLKYNFYKT